MNPNMDPKTKKQLLQSVATVMTLTRDELLDEAGLDAVSEATECLALYSGRTVTAAFVEWQRTGSIRRDPRPRPLYTVADPAPGRPAPGRLTF